MATNNYGAFILIPPLMQRLQIATPQINIEVWGVGRFGITGMTGAIDVTSCVGGSGDGGSDGWNCDDRNADCPTISPRRTVANSTAPDRAGGV
jgi:hypothetical protein